jgi:hypothetical protein
MAFVSVTRLRAMPRLAGWCDEAAVAHWTTDAGADLPTIVEAHARLGAEGRLTPVDNPSAAHTARAFAAPRSAVGRSLALTPDNRPRRH